MGALYFVTSYFSHHPLLLKGPDDERSFQQASQNDEPGIQ